MTHMLIVYRYYSNYHITIIITTTTITAIIMNRIVLSLNGYD